MNEWMNERMNKYFRMKINAKKDMTFRRPDVVIIKCEFLSLTDSLTIED